MIDASRRLDAAVGGSHFTLEENLGAGKFDCITFNDRLGMEKDPATFIQQYLPILENGGKVNISLHYKEHFSKIAYDLFNIKRPPFTAVDGTLQYYS